MTDSEKLRLLADWFDMKYEGIDQTDEVQNDLRRIADKLEQREDDQLNSHTGMTQDERNNLG